LIASAGLGSEINIDYISGFVKSLDRRSLKPLLGNLFADESLVTRQLVDDMLKYKRLEGVTEALQKLADSLFENGVQRKTFEDIPDSFGKPVLSIWGEEDRIIPASHVPKIKNQVRVETLPGQGHMVQMEAANEVNRLIVDFLN
jgi:pyruvate dehydrogenase E2 component (dihydrolipoamide acetyltransferase)